MRPSFLIYDDSCSFCRKKAEEYKNKDGMGDIRLIGKSEANQYLSVEIVEKCDFEREIHLIEPDGSIYRGGTFLHRFFSKYAPKTLKNRFLGLPLWKPFLILGYKLIARLRHQLPF